MRKLVFSSNGFGLMAPKRPMALCLDMLDLEYGPYKVCSSDDPILIYFSLTLN